jgi:hypothetical protein
MIPSGYGLIFSFHWQCGDFRCDNSRIIRSEAKRIVTPYQGVAEV